MSGDELQAVRARAAAIMRADGRFEEAFELLLALGDAERMAEIILERAAMLLAATTPSPQRRETRRARHGPRPDAARTSATSPGRLRLERIGVSPEQRPRRPRVLALPRLHRRDARRALPGPRAPASHPAVRDKSTS
jgi:hypothetical protein